MKKVLITGSSSGIGAAIADLLLSQQMTVVGIARTHKNAHPNYFPYSIDCSQLVGLETAFKKVHAAHEDIDAVICCCGFGHFVELEQFSFQQMQAMMNVNFLSQALLIKTFISTLKKREAAKIILLGSECAQIGQKKGSLYCASKFALRGFAQSLRHECRAANIAVSLINPGMVDTPFFEHLEFRPGSDDSHAIQPEQIAAMIEMVLKLDNNCVVEEINCQQMVKVIVKNTSAKAGEL